MPSHQDQVQKIGEDPDRADLLNLTAPLGGVTIGAPVQIGQLLVVPRMTAPAGTRFTAWTVGIFPVPKAPGETWDEGEPLYWDADNERFTATAGSLLFGGCAVAGATSAALTGRVRLAGTVAGSGGGGGGGDLPALALGKIWLGNSEGAAAAVALAGAVFDFNAVQGTTNITLDHADSLPKQLLAADAAHDRLVLIMAEVTEAFPSNTAFDLAPAIVQIRGAKPLGTKLAYFTDLAKGVPVLAGLPRFGSPPSAGTMAFRIRPITTDVADLSVTNAKLANMARGCLKAGAASTDGPASDLDVSAAGAIPVGDGTDVVARVLSGDMTMDGAGATRVADALRPSGLGMTALVYSPSGVAIDSLGRMYFADELTHRIRRVVPLTGLVETVAGTGVQSSTGDGGLAVHATLNLPFALAFDAAGNLFFTQTGGQIRRIDVSTGIITTVVASGLGQPWGLAFNSAGTLHVSAQTDNKVYSVDLGTGELTLVAGTTVGFDGDGDVATAAKLENPMGIAFDSADNLYIADQLNNRIRKVDGSTGVITTVVGTGTASFSGDGGLATAATINTPCAVAFDPITGALLIADTLNNRVRSVDAGTGFITTITGTGSATPSGDGGVATAAGLQPWNLATSGYTVLLAETNACVRAIDLGTGIIDTIAGIAGKTGFSIGINGNVPEGKVWIGDSAARPRPRAIKGDATLAADGTLSIGEGKVTPAMLQGGLGAAALLASALSGSWPVEKTDAGSFNFLNAYPAADRACLVLVRVDETYDPGTGELPTVAIGETDAPTKGMGAGVLTNQLAGTTLAFAFMNTAGKALTVTSTAAGGDATGGCTIVVLAIPSATDEPS